jgi:hypothetical protein
MRTDILTMYTPLRTDEELEAAYALGLMRKEDLVHGQYYFGLSRNTQIARWHAGAERFVHFRTKFGQTFCETLRHPVDERHYDVFRVKRVTEPEPHEVLDDERFEKAATGQGA